MASLCKKCRCGRDGWDACDHTWLIRQRVGGREVYANVGADRQAAERALARLDAEPEETVTDALTVWLEAKERAPDARHNSLASYRGRVKRVERSLGHIPVRSVRPDHLTAFVVELLKEGYAPATTSGIYGTLTSALRHAQRRGVIRHLPLPPDGPGIPSVAPRTHYLSLVQVEEVIERLPEPYGKVAELVLLTGLRWGEVVAIKPGDVDGHLVRVRRTSHRGGGVNEPKTRQGRRIIPLSDRAVQLLEELDLPVGGHYWKARDALVKAMGSLHRKGMGWHTLRAAHASLLDASGVSLRESAARMGHGANYAVTFSYQLAREAGDARQLDAIRHAATSAPSASPDGSSTPAPLPRPGRSAPP